jgi:ketosteroid isomerase-like protein
MATQNSKAVIQGFFDHLAKGDLATASALMAPDMVYTLIGSGDLSGTFHGMEEIAAKLFGPLQERLEAPIRLTLKELIGEGNRVAALATGEAQGRFGPYNNTYCFVFTVKDGHIATLDEYLDTVLVETALYGRKLV